MLLASLVTLAVAGFPLPGYSVAPGKTKNVSDVVSVGGTEVFPPAGEVLVSTVALHPLTPFRALQAWLDGDIKTVPKQRVAGSRARARARSESEQVAVAVALRRIGLVVPETGTGAVVETVRAGSPAASRLVPGDVITGINGRPISIAEEAIETVRAHGAGRLLRMDVRAPDGSRRVEEIELGSLEGTEQGFLGVALATEQRRFEYPVHVDVDLGGIDGNSAGLALTVGLLDMLTPGELTKGEKVALTGTVELDGRVGEVGSVAQKATAARKAGARYFLVPGGMLGEATRGGGEKLQVIEVSTLDDALRVLDRLGLGDGVAP
ncbi:MAG: PDZ domain-containing protein [Actinomycetota bacterium]|nr:PDZ domain-containing protein [Actinomycetota bacterium]